MSNLIFKSYWFHLKVTKTHFLERGYMGFRFFKLISDFFLQELNLMPAIWRENKTKQHSFQCHATVIRMKMKISYIRGKVGRHSHECLVTVVRQSRDIFSKLD